MTRRILPTLAALLAVACMARLCAEPLNLYIAAGASGAVAAFAEDFEAETGMASRSVYASSSALARQIQNGAPFDLYLSANPKWMDVVQEAGLLDTESRQELWSTDLVLIVPKGKAFAVEMEPAFDFAGSFNGRLAIGEPESVPAGRYARDALQAIGWWQGVEKRVLPCRNVKVALRMVEMGECEAGLVYRSDALASDKVEVLAVMPVPRPILFSAALPAEASPDARRFYQALLSEKGAAVFRQHGFEPLFEVAAP